MNVVKADRACFPGLSVLVKHKELHTFCSGAAAVRYVNTTVTADTRRVEFDGKFNTRKCTARLWYLCSVVAVIIYRVLKLRDKKIGSRCACNSVVTLQFLFRREKRLRIDVPRQIER